MTSGISQHRVAIVSIRFASSHGLRFTNGLAPHSQVRRWQSTAAKGISTSGDDQLSSNRNEIPLSCFVEAATFPTPSLKQTSKITDVDLTSTRPAKLDSPVSPERRDYPDGNIPLTDRVKYLFKLGKSYLLFYKTGLKNVWSNSKQYRALKQELQGNTLNTAAKYGGQTIDGKVIPEISRSQYQLSLRSRHDVFKMVPFSLVFLICGEFTPLVIIALGSSIVPYTCRIPQQERKDLEKKVRQDQQYMDDLPMIFPEIETPVEAPDWRIEHLDAYRLGITSFRTPMPIVGPLYHSLVIRPRLVRHCDNIISDTLMIQREGGVFKLSYQDIYEWANSYGLYAFRQYVEKCQKSGQEPRSERLKTELLPHVEREMKYMLDQVADWSRLQPTEQWRIGLRTVGSRSPDWEARIKDMRKNWKHA